MGKEILLPPGFQPTYEELKPGHGEYVNITLPGFQPTYEELKLKMPKQIQR